MDRYEFFLDKRPKRKPVKRDKTRDKPKLGSLPDVTIARPYVDRPTSGLFTMIAPSGYRLSFYPLNMSIGTVTNVRADGTVETGTHSQVSLSFDCSLEEASRIYGGQESRENGR
jgi:hypothetical protein